MGSRGSILLGPEQITLLTLNAIKDGLENDFIGTCATWEIHKHVADIIASLTYPQIAALASRAGGAHVMRLAHGANIHFWADIRRALDHEDTSGLEFSLLSRLLSTPIPQQNAASA